MSRYYIKAGRRTMSRYCIKAGPLKWETSNYEHWRKVVRFLAWPFFQRKLSRKPW